MADSDKKVSYEVTADASGFEGGMQRAADAARNATGSIESNFKRVQDAFGAVQKQLLVLAGIVAGGTFFKAAIDASNQLTGETVKLQKALGLTGEQASTLRSALSDIGSSGDQYVDAFSKFARQLKSNEKGINDLGIKTRDTNGNLRDSDELFRESLGSVSQYKAGIDQTMYAQTLFGKSIDEVRTLQKLNNDELEKARKKNEELGLVITKDNVEGSKAYKRAMNDVGDVLMAVKKVIGDAVMPIFTAMGEYLASAGPALVEVFKGAMFGLVVVFEVVKGAVKTVAGVIFEAFNLIIEGGGMLGEMISKLLVGDFSGAYQSAKEFGQRVGQSFTHAMANFIDAGDEVGAAVKRQYERTYGEKKGTDAPKGGSKRMGMKDDKDTSRVSQWDVQLSESKLAFQELRNQQGSFEQFSKAQELAFWKEKLAITTSGTAENVAVRKKVAELQLSINSESYQREVAVLNTREAAFKNNMAARLAVLDQEASLVRQRYGQESKEYEAVQKKIVETKRQAVEQQKQIDTIRAESVRSAQLAELEVAIQQAQLARDLHAISDADLLSMQQQFEARRFAIQAEALRERLEIAKADPDRNPVELARLQAEIEQSEAQHQRRLGEIRNQASRESQRFATGAFESIQSGWAQTIQKFAQGQLTIAGFFRSMWQAVVQATVGAFAQMAAQWLAQALLARLLSKTTASGEITANAGVAGAGAYAATAAIPYVGPILAPAAAATAFAGALSYGSVLASAAGGYDIGNVNPIVQAHAQEMVLPARIANTIRGLADQQEQGGGGQRAPADVQIKVHQMPGDFWMVHRADLAKAIKSAQRDYVLR